MTEKSYTDSPSKHRKIIRGFPQSQSTKVLLPSNTQKLEKTLKAVTNNMTIMTDSASDKNHDLAIKGKQRTYESQEGVKHFHKITDNSSLGGLDSRDIKK